MSNESINKLILSDEDAMSALDLPEEAFKLLMNIKEADKPKEVKAQVFSNEETFKLFMNIKDADKPKEAKAQVFSNPEEAINNSALPQDALSLLMNIKEADKIIEKNLTSKRETENNEIISKMSFNPNTGFTIDLAMLARLNLMSATPAPPPAPPKDEKPVFIRPEEAVGISISNTSQFSVEERNSLVRSFNIIEEGIFLGIIIGSTNKTQAIDILSQYSSYKYDSETAENIISYDDISITVYFDEENIVNQLEFGKSFRGNTSKGLKIGDTVENAIALYGPPTMKSPKGAFWKNLKVFCSAGYITSIKIQR